MDNAVKAIISQVTAFGMAQATAFIQGKIQELIDMIEGKELTEEELGQLIKDVLEGQKADEAEERALLND